MRLIVRYVALCLCFVSFFSQACDISSSKQGSAVVALGGYIYIQEESLTPEDGAVDFDDVALAIYYYDCDTGKSKFVGELPYLAATGSVHSVFFLKPVTERENKLIVIHGVEIRSDTGIAYVGDYYSVHVFDVDGKSYARDDKSSQYFGYGGDIVNNYDENITVYRYPYKLEREVRTEFASTNFNGWFRDDDLELNITSRAPLYSSPVIVDATGEYLSAGAQVRQIGAQAGWIEVKATTHGEQNVLGWVMRDDIRGRDVE